MKNFMRGVFWTLFIGMAAYIGYLHYPDEAGYTFAQRQAMDSVVLSVADLEE